MMEFAILTLLRTGADHGYRLRQRLQARLAPIWNVNAGQLYRTLSRLRRSGWIEELPPDAIAPEGHDRWPVALTPSGREALSRWPETPIEPIFPPPPPRHEILARLSLGGYSHRNAIESGIDREHELWSRAEAEVADLEKDLTPTARDASEISKRLALAARRCTIRAHLEWLEICRREVERCSNGTAAQSSN
jgi:DNA-binding PadR family transcriptional regulator